MTTAGPDYDELPEEELEVEPSPESLQEPPPEPPNVALAVAEEDEDEEVVVLYQVSFQRLEQLERSAIHLLASRLTDDSPSRSAPVVELNDPQALVREIRDNYDTDPQFIRSDMPIQEIVFRTLLARGNEPITLTDLHYELTERWATPLRPIVISEDRLQRVLDADTYYGFVQA